MIINIPTSFGMLFQTLKIGESKISCSNAKSFMNTSWTPSRMMKMATLIGLRTPSNGGMCMGFVTFLDVLTVAIARFSGLNQHLLTIPTIKRDRRQSLSSRHNAGLEKKRRLFHQCQRCLQIVMIQIAPP